MAGAVLPLGCANIAYAQVTAPATAGGIQIVAARPGRGEVQITNTSTVPVYLGDSALTAATGHLLPGIVGASVTIKTSAAVYGITASSTALVTALETF